MNATSESFVTCLDETYTVDSARSTTVSEMMSMCGVMEGVLVQP